ncbi:MAG: hypothetical protein ACHBN1_27135 [Heteroscytonema crispum UTEX LB 1556]
MERIIRSNAVETSNQASGSGMNLHYLHPTQDLIAEMVSINISTITSLTTALAATPTNSDSDTATTHQAVIINASNWSTSLQTMLGHQPTVIPQLVLLGSIAFFADVMAWAWTEKIRLLLLVEKRGKGNGKRNFLPFPFTLYPFPPMSKKDFCSLVYCRQRRSTQGKLYLSFWIEKPMKN